MSQTPSTEVTIGESGDHLIVVKLKGEVLCRVLIMAKASNVPTLLITGQWKVESNLHSMTMLASEEQNGEE